MLRWWARRSSPAAAVQDDASKEDFCEAYTKVDELEGVDYGEGKDAFEELADVGTPEDIDDDARDGFEILADLIDDADDEDEALEALDDLDTDDKDRVGAFYTYASDECSEDSASGGSGGSPATSPTP